MPDFIPLSPSQTNYRLRVPLDDRTFIFDIRWNSRDAAYYIDILQDDDTPIARGLKLVLGASPGRHASHQFFEDHLFRMVDYSNTGLDVGFDDISTRVFLMHISRRELVNLGDPSA